jgi:hypothetical protein
MQKYVAEPTPVNNSAATNALIAALTEAGAGGGGPGGPGARLQSGPGGIATSRTAGPGGDGG